MLGNISWPQLLILLVIVVLIFGTKRLSGLGKDVGGAIRSFKGAMKEEENKPAEDTDTKDTAEKLETKEQDADFAESQKTEAKETDKS